MDWSYDHPCMTMLISAVFVGVLCWSICFLVENCSKQHQMKQAKTADFVMYTNDGEMLGLDYEVIVDMDTGYQYLIFCINGNYVAVPRVDENGNFYKTIE